MKKIEKNSLKSVKVIMGELIKRKETQITQKKEPINIEITESDKGKMEYFKTEIERLKGIEKTIKDLGDNYVRAINDRTLFKTKYNEEIELNKQLINELNTLKQYRTIIDLTINCPELNRKINIFDCNRGYNNICKIKDKCTNRRILIEDIKNKY